MGGGGPARVVGLTGGIATGKSTVAALLRDVHGLPVIDADRVAREVVAPGSPALAEIVAAFGPDVLDGTGGLDRPAMRARIAADPDARRRLEAITHPAIRAGIAARLARLTSPVAFVEAALLVETGSHRRYPDLWVVTCAPETQLARLMARDGMDREAARRFIATQLPLADKEAVATRVIRNDGSREALAAAVADAVASLRDPPPGGDPRWA